MKKLITSLLVSAALTSLASAGVVTGVVKSAKSGNVLSNRTVSVHVGGDKYTAKSDRNGVYYIVTPGHRDGQKATMYCSGRKVRSMRARAKTYVININLG